MHFILRCPKYIFEAVPPVSTRYKFVSLDITTFPFETNLGLLDVPKYIFPPNLTVFHPLS